MLQRIFWISSIATLGVILAEVLVALSTSSGLADTSALSLTLLLLVPLAFPISAVGSLCIFGLRQAWYRLSGKQTVSPALALGLTVYTSIAALVTLKVGLSVGQWVARTFRQASYQDLALVLSTICVLGLFTLLYAPVRLVVAAVYRALGRLWSLANLSRTSALVFVTLILTIIVWRLPIWFPLLSSVDLRILWIGLAWCLSFLIADTFIKPGSNLRVVAWLFVIAMVVASPFAAQSVVEANYSAVGIVEQHSIVTRRALRLFQRWSDQDGDGASALFGGGDCNDADPKIRPGRLDLPSDGIDQNCSGADFILPPKHKRSAPRTALLDHASPRPNVIVLTIDALRYDQLATDMPFLRGLAQDSVNFEHAYSHGASTYWSVASMMTSKLPSQLIMGRDQTPVSSETLLAEIFTRHGWRTSLFANVTIFFVRGLSQGIDHANRNYATSHFTIHGEKPGAKHLTDGMLKKLRILKKGGNTQPVFMWGHYYDPHDPYFEVPEYPADSDGDFDRYRAIVRSVDAQIARFVDGLKALDMWENTILVVTSDHGEEFGEHGGRFHGKTLYEEMTRVPLLIRIPNVAGRLVKTPLGQMDIAPTLLGLLGLPIPASFRGHNHAVALNAGTEIDAKPVVLEVLPDSKYGGHLIAVRAGQYKVIYHLRNHFFEVYDLAADPHETRNIGPHEQNLVKTVLEMADLQLYYLALGKTGAKRPMGTPRGFDRRPRP